MAKSRVPQPETPEESQPRDLFQTPQYAVDLLIPFIPKRITKVWECAAGERRMANRLVNHGYDVWATDIRENLDGVDVFNFMTEMTIPNKNNTAIITNPPYSLKRKFFEKCLEEYHIPFALLISGDYSMWTINAVWKQDCEKIIPNRRIDYITPTGKSGATGNTSYFHTYWMTWGFGLGRTETFVDLTKEMKANI